MRRLYCLLDCLVLTVIHIRQQKRYAYFDIPSFALLERKVCPDRNYLCFL